MLLAVATFCIIIMKLPRRLFPSSYNGGICVFATTPRLGLADSKMSFPSLPAPPAHPSLANSSVVQIVGNDRSFLSVPGDYLGK